MNQFDDDTTSASAATLPTLVEEESTLVRLAGAGDKAAFDQLYDRYFARASWFYLTIFTQREARVAVKELLTELFGSLSKPSHLSFAERAYRMAVATELRHTAAQPKRDRAKAKHAKVEDEPQSNAP